MQSYFVIWVGRDTFRRPQGRGEGRSGSIIIAVWEMNPHFSLTRATRNLISFYIVFHSLSLKNECHFRYFCLSYCHFQIFWLVVEI